MTDLSREWPFGLGGARWWVPVLAGLALIALAFPVDHELSLWAQSWPAPIRGALEQVTPYGESGWILIPSLVLYVVTVLVAVLVRWKLMRLMLWQFASLYAFIFVGVGLPSLVATVVKRLIGRGRPMHYDETGLFGFHLNWVDWTYQSFPSGHSTTAFALAAVVGFLSERWFYPALALAAAIGLSRITEGVHYPSDVIAGAMLGLLGAYAARWYFAQRGWTFRTGPDGRIHARALSTLKRYIALKRQGISPAPKPDRP